MVTKKNEVKVMDFGLARHLTSEDVHLTQTGVTMGTPLYMSPEQLQGHSLDHRTDIYSFGVMCYHMIAGRPPFTGETAVAVALQHVSGKPAPLREIRPEFPAELIGIVERMLAKKPDDRYQSARAILNDLRRLQAGLPPEFDLVGSIFGNDTTQTRLDQTAGYGSMSRTVTLMTELFREPGRNPWLVAASLLLATIAGLTAGWAGRVPTLAAPRNIGA